MNWANTATLLSEKPIAPTSTIIHNNAPWYVVSCNVYRIEEDAIYYKVNLVNNKEEESV
jgi:hypothetical protein